LEKSLERPTFGNVGRLRPQKDPLFFREVAINSKSLIPDSHWAWMGEGESSYKELLIESNIEMKEWASGEDLQKFYQNLTCLVITSAWESGPLTLVESLMEGTPVIIRESTASEILEISDASNPIELAKLLFVVCSKKNALEEIFNHHRDQILKYYDESSSNSYFYKQEN
jgi:glycosyltransferase involved in cell wall biosynthesis